MTCPRVDAAAALPGRARWPTYAALGRTSFAVVTRHRHATGWQERPSDAMARVSNETIRSGGIILVHDSIFERQDRSRAPMIAALHAVSRRPAKRLRS